MLHSKPGTLPRLLLAACQKWPGALHLQVPGTAAAAMKLLPPAGAVFPLHFFLPFLGPQSMSPKSSCGTLEKWLLIIVAIMEMNYRLLLVHTTKQ